MTKTVSGTLFSAICLLFSALLLIFSLLCGIDQTAANNAIRASEQEIEALESEIERLTARCESSMDLASLEVYAIEQLGMQRCTPAQIRMIPLSE